MPARPFFIVSSGRSGTKMMERLFAGLPQLTMEHEYLCPLVQPLAVRRYWGMASPADARRVLAEAHGAAIHYAATPVWGDSSNKLSWLIPDLAALFPEARFVHLVRDGRKVTSSYFHKLGQECYDDAAVRTLQAYLDDPLRSPAPPAEKRYWWPVPRPDDPRAGDFRRLDQFGRIAWHWGEIHRVIDRALAALPPDRQHLVRLEDLVAEPYEAARLFAFLDIDYDAGRERLLARPHNVNRPVDTPLTDGQQAQLHALAGDVMARFGYDRRPAYVVNY